jgi:hypothetical protein
MAENIASSAARQQGCLLRSALSESALEPKPGFWEGKMSGLHVMEGCLSEPGRWMGQSIVSKGLQVYKLVCSISLRVSVVAR